MLSHSILFKFPVMHLKGKSTPVGGGDDDTQDGAHRDRAGGYVNVQRRPNRGYGIFNSRKSMPVIICCCRDEKHGGCLTR